MSILTEKRIFWAVFGIAFVLVGCAYSLFPHYIRFATLASEDMVYYPLTQTADFDTMNVHGARYRDIVDGGVFSGEVDTWEHRDAPALWPLLSAAMLWPLLAPFDTVFPGIILSDLLFPLGMFVMFFLIVRLLTKSDWFALVSAYLVMLFPQLVLLIPPSSVGELKHLLMQFSPVPFEKITTQLMFLRREAQIPGGPFFLFFFFAVLKLLSADESRKRLWIILSGIGYGLLFYLYFYFWVFATIFLGLLFIALFFTDREKAWRILHTVIDGAFVSIPFWINQYHLTGLPTYTELIDRMGLELGHGFRFALWKTYALFMAMAGVLFWLSKKIDIRKEAIFLGVLAITGIVAYNVNVVTGFFPQSDHWSGRVFVVTNALIWPALAFYFFKWASSRYVVINKPGVFGIILVFLAVSLSSNVFVSEWRVNTEHAKDHTVSPALMAAYEWLNENTPKDSVVLAAAFPTNVDIPVYTHNRVYVARSQNTVAGEEEILERLYSGWKMLGLPLETLARELDSQRGIIYLFTVKYGSTDLYAHLRPDKFNVYILPSEVKERALSGYVAYDKEETPYKLDYIFVGPLEREWGARVARSNELPELYNKDGVAIYKYGKD